jgi:glycosyltransferase involved in cell wall biosynthesis
VSPELSVIVPARDAETTLAATLTGLTGQSLGERLEVIVVDNGSLDGTAALASASAAVSKVIRRERGEGPGAARNAGARAASAPVLAFLDADCRPAPGWSAAGLAAVQSADLVIGKVLPDDVARLGPFDRTLWVTSLNGLFESANMFVRRELFERIDGFPAGLEPSDPADGGAGAPFGEDVLFGWRACRTGARVEFCEDALAYHAITVRTPAEYVCERKRMALFPELVGLAPELRRAFLYRRYFLNRRSMRFDAAVACALCATVRRRPAYLAAGLPYLMTVIRGGLDWGTGSLPAVAAAQVSADAIGAAALIAGSVRSGSIVL